MLKNLTPHKVAFQLASGEMKVLEPTGIVPRVSEQATVVGVVSIEDDSHPNGVTVSLMHVTAGRLEGLPEPQKGIIYIVSRLVAEAARDRDDLVFPFELVRDNSGTIVGCGSLGTVAEATRDANPANERAGSPRDPA